MKPQIQKYVDRIHDAPSTFKVAIMDSMGHRETYFYDWKVATEATEDPSFQYLSGCYEHAWYNFETTLQTLRQYAYC